MIDRYPSLDFKLFWARNSFQCVCSNMKPLLNIIINSLPLIAITVMISSKLLWQHTRNSCSLPQNGGRELPRDTPSHILLSFTPLEQEETPTKPMNHSRVGCSPRPVPTTKSDQVVLLHKWSLPQEKSLTPSSFLELLW